jgi:hypothetical protein
MKIRRRQFLRLALSAVAIPSVSGMASALGYPTRPVRVIVPYPAGGATDIFARLAAQRLSERLGKQFMSRILPGPAATSLPAKRREQRPMVIRSLLPSPRSS